MVEIRRPGLSPRVRGNRGYTRNGQSVQRSIPACAGEPAPRRTALAIQEVYPRVCGGTCPASLTSHCDQGLSPRVRGNPEAEAPERPREGSIPACAGEPTTPSRHTSTHRVYPRVCGGTNPATPGHVARWGLSPRVRGNLNVIDEGMNDDGSIPACAGEPQGRYDFNIPAGVYPRVCGGTCQQGLPYWEGHGLSPRVRGNPPNAVIHKTHFRSIPACAGEPYRFRRYRKSNTVYPRVCGGTIYRKLSP